MKKIILVFLLLVSFKTSADVLKLIVPFAAGGPADLVARQVQQDLANELNLSVVLINKPGAGGDIGTQLLLNSDSHDPVLLFHSSALILNILVKKQNFDTSQLTPIVNLGTQSMVLVVNPNSRLKTMADWEKLDSSISITHSNGGVGSATFICGEILTQEIKKNIIQIPFKGQSEQIRSVLDGTVDASFVWTTNAMPYIREKQLYPVAVVSPMRVHELPNTPTFNELSIHHLEFQPFMALFMSSKVSPEIRIKIQSVMSKILLNKETRKPYEKLGLTIIPNPKLDNSFIETQKQIYSRLLENIKISQ